MMNRVTAMSRALFKFKPFSARQLQILRWWVPGSPFHDYDGIIADGAIRSGKTVAMGPSFVEWAMHTFNEEQFGMCGKSIGSLRRNVINPLKRILPGRGYKVVDRRGDNCLVISKGNVTNYFFLFGGKDESSQDLIQGITLAGILLDEVVLMPESFVNQATGRCSVEGAKLWFNCNPDNRQHWFKLNWINKYKKKRLLYLHFTMDDNLSLSEEVKAKYRNRYVGMFFRRYILGEWVSADGLIYDMWSDGNTFSDDDFAKVDGGWQKYKEKCRRYVSCDYGTTNPTVFLDAYDDGKTIWIDNEYYFDSKKAQRQKTDSEYADDFEEFVGYDHSVEVILDPSAESFRVELKNRGYRVRAAKNDVLDGIRVMSTFIRKKYLRVRRTACPNFLREIASYIWDEKAAMRGDEKPIKLMDHAMDACRYLLRTVIPRWRLSM